ncbi:squalene synthase HpnC [Parapusillimonas sp. SGNA-6]|nr:squalene synthase HpnC [Parapusillimonas sp. SGNA-6]
MAVDHYENFPVASLLLPRPLRAPVKAIYRFARSADDIADEGDAPPDRRLARLAAYRRALGHIQDQSPASIDENLTPVFVPLAAAISRWSLPMAPFFDLLSAFEQDVVTQRYDDDAQLLDYCRRSANPVGRLMLHLYGAATPENVTDADAVCTGLQLTNFWQDVAVDWHKDRVYLPLDKLSRHGVDLDYLARRATVPSHSGATDAHPDDPEAPQPSGGIVQQDTAADAAWRALMREQVDQARGMLLRGLPLTRRLPARIGFELRLVVHGGLRILERLDQLHYDMFRHRPTLTKVDWALLLYRALA